MDIKSRIRVIKLAEQKRRAKVLGEKRRLADAHSMQDKGRSGAATITGWVDELRQQKQQSADAVSGFNNLFEDAA